MSNVSKLYLVVRSDLSIAQQAVQAAHALLEFNLLHADLARRWHDESNTLAFLSVPDESLLVELADRAALIGVELAHVREPDLGDSLTALAIGPAGKRITRRLPRALI